MMGDELRDQAEQQAQRLCGLLDLELGESHWVLVYQVREGSWDVLTSKMSTENLRKLLEAARGWVDRPPDGQIP